MQLYDALPALTGSVVVAINRTVALAAQSDGPRGAAEGLAALDVLEDDGQLRVPAVLGGVGSASRQSRQCAGSPEGYRRAIGLETDPAGRRFLQAEPSRLEAGPR